MQGSCTAMSFPAIRHRKSLYANLETRHAWTQGSGSNVTGLFAQLQVSLLTQHFSQDGCVNYLHTNIVAASKSACECMYITTIMFRTQGNACGLTLSSCSMESPTSSSVEWLLSSSCLSRPMGCRRSVVDSVRMCRRSRICVMPTVSPCKIQAQHAVMRTHRCCFMHRCERRWSL